MYINQLHQRRSQFSIARKVGIIVYSAKSIQALSRSSDNQKMVGVDEQPLEITDFSKILLPQTSQGISKCKYADYSYLKRTSDRWKHIGPQICFPMSPDFGRRRIYRLSEERYH